MGRLDHPPCFKINVFYIVTIGITSYSVPTVATDVSCDENQECEVAAPNNLVDASALLQGSLRVEHVSVGTPASAKDADHLPNHTLSESFEQIRSGRDQVLSHRPVPELLVGSRKPPSSSMLLISMYLTGPFDWHMLPGGAILILLLLCLFLAITYFNPQSAVVKALCLCVVYNCVSVSMIETNKWLMHPDRFPYPMTLTSNHMLASWFFTYCLRFFYPSAFPALEHLVVTWHLRVKFFAIGVLFATSVVCSTAAYKYLSVPFLQVMKQANVAVIYTFSVICGLDALRRCSIMLLACTVFGTFLTIRGELQFQLLGFILQVGSSLAEASKVIAQGLLMSGSAKLDPLTLVLFMAPSCLLAIAPPFVAVEANSAMFVQYMKYLPVLLANAMLAFSLNVVVAFCIKQLSPVGYIMMGTLKDVLIVSSSAVLLGETLTLQQMVGFAF